MVLATGAGAKAAAEAMATAKMTDFMVFVVLVKFVRDVIVFKVSPLCFRWLTQGR